MFRLVASPARCYICLFAHYFVNFSSNSFLFIFLVVLDNFMLNALLIHCSVVVSVIVKRTEFNSASVPTSHISMLIQHLDEIFTRID